jgi:hypothetical protein
MVDAEEILPKAEENRTKWKEYVRDVAEIFHNNEGELFERDTAITKITESLDITENTAQKTLSALVSDIVDPVVQVPADDTQYIGVIEYHEYEGAYGYLEFDDVSGKENRVVCAQCVKESTTDKEVTHATAGSGSFDEDADFDELYNAVLEHYNNSHDTVPESVETGASLLSGTTIGSNSAIHTGNENSLSFYDGTTLLSSVVEANDKVILPVATEGDTITESGVIAYDSTNEQLVVSK